MRPGVLEQKFLLTGQDGAPDNYLINVGRTGSGGWSTPRHRHNFDQVRYVMKGSYPISGDKRMPEGSVGYFPEGAYYGPQDRPEGLEMMVCQFGGASGAGFMSVAQREAANEVLQRKGTFKDGIFTWYDEHGKKHNQDGFEACYEQATGRKMVYPKPRYDDIILMNPATYEWVPDAEPGVFSKWLGWFTERQAGLGFVRVAAGATLSVGMQSSIELLFLARGRVVADGREYSPHAAFEFQAHEGPVPLEAVTEAEFLRIVLPRF
jgi:hypothetical protein